MFIWSDIMNERIARVRAHQRNIERYEGLLKSCLTEIELRFVNQRLLEERKSLAMLQLMNPSDPVEMIQLPLPDAVAVAATARFRSEA
jgi:hypothetical protein